MGRIGFNSILVQLEWAKFYIKKGWCMEFQFHIGAIRIQGAYTVLQFNY